jgi:hypothetical protein
MVLSQKDFGIAFMAGRKPKKNIRVSTPYICGYTDKRHLSRGICLVFIGYAGEKGKEETLEFYMVFHHAGKKTP